MSQSITGIIDWLNDWLEEKSNKVSSWSSTTSDTRYPSEKLVKDSLDGKSDFNHLHPISDITTPIYSSSQIDTMLQNIKGDTATDVMDKVGMMYALRNETTHNISSLITSYYQGIMEFGLSSVLEDYIIDGVEGVYEIRDYRFPDLFYYYDGTNLTCLTPTKIRLTCTDYNPDINSTVTVRAELTDMFDNSIPFENLRLEIEQGGVGNSVDLITDSNGVATYNYSCSSWGVCRFSIKSFDTYINISGWKEYTGLSIATVYYNQEYTHITFSGTTSFPTGFTTFSGQTLPTSLSPNASAVTPVANNQNCFILVDSNGNIQRKTANSSAISSASMNSQMIFRRKG